MYVYINMYIYYLDRLMKILTSWCDTLLYTLLACHCIIRHFGIRACRTCLHSIL